MSTKILIGDCRETLKSLPDQSVHCVITSPPYWGLRSYKGDTGMIGLEATWNEHLENLMEVFNEVWRVLRDDGTLWLNYGDAYHKKQLMMMPSKIAIAMQENNWILRSEIIWAKTKCTPEDVRDRPVRAHEKIFLLTKQYKYFYDYEAVKTEVKRHWKAATNNKANINKTSKYDQYKTPSKASSFTKDSDKLGGANLRNVWHLPTGMFKEAHFATFPTKLVEPCIKAGTIKKGVVLDPFGGAGTVSIVAERLNRDSIICEISPEYAEMAKNRIEGESLPMFPTIIEVI